jgi:hypothetical protein
MGQRDKLFEDVADCLEWMSDENFREFVTGVSLERPGLVRRLRKELDRAERKQLTRP